MSEASPRRVKKRPNVFANVIANAEDVVQSSFIAGGPSRDGAALVVSTAFAPVPAPEPLRELEPEPAAAAAAAAKEPREAEPAVVEPAAPPDNVRVEMPVPTPPPSRAPETSELEERSAPRPEAGPPKGEARLAAVADADRARPPAQVAEVAEVKRAPADRAAVGLPRRAPAARRGTQPWSHQAVLESFASATIDSKTWTLHGFRIVPEVLTILKARMNADRRSTGNQKLAISHYLDAALRQVPTEVEQQIALAQEFLTARMGMVEAGRQSTYRVGRQASTLVTDMNVGLQEADYGRKGIYVVSASIESFLAAMDEAGELKRPELPGDR